MSDKFLYTLTLASLLGCGLLAGLFYAFSSFVMRGLADMPPEQGLAAMQAINQAVSNPWFMLGFLGTPALCLTAGVVSLVRWGEPGSVSMLVGAVLYLVGGLLLTIVFHIPRNNAMALLDPTAADSAAKWAHYVTVWTAGNHIRTLASLAATAFFAVSLSQLS